MIAVRIDSSRPIFIEADAASFGVVFANANTLEQAEILKAICDGLKPYAMQKDYIAFELANPEYAEVRTFLADLIAPIDEDAASAGVDQ